ncbi:hypothetical protein [Streptomyces triticirhizae]|uniref:Asp23/Gls24 family envelope stress response protein n=1 Tax=Streptomyces triticirhizae TaxID=2483353 RepID=A0A3M2LDD6_9ACTN|nr:hypothetical protein [Streptomyces triticirhizae]RMI34613.1 hypothetical protein EBN88_23460 [Streptomyces triticirhizae]
MALEGAGAPGGDEERGNPARGSRERDGRERGDHGREGERAPEEEVLACGRSLAGLWEAWDEGRAGTDPHVRDCPSCRAALAELRALGEVVAATRAEEERAPEAGGLASRVTTRVMEIVRLELRPGRTLPLGEPNEDAWIVEAAVARVFREAVEELDAVRVGSCRIAPVGRAAPGERPPRGPVAVRIEVVAGLRWTVPELAEAVRGRLAVAADEELGLEVRTVDVHVLDLTDTLPGATRRRLR